MSKLFVLAFLSAVCLLPAPLPATTDAAPDFVGPHDSQPRAREEFDVTRNLHAGRHPAE